MASKSVQRCIKAQLYSDTHGHILYQKLQIHFQTFQLHCCRITLLRRQGVLFFQGLIFISIFIQFGSISRCHVYNATFLRSACRNYLNKLLRYQALYSFVASIKLKNLLYKKKHIQFNFINKLILLYSPSS